MKRSLLLVVLAIIAPSACDNNIFGEDIGRPPVHGVNRPARLPVSIVEVFAAGGASRHYADLLLPADFDSLDLDGLSLCDGQSHEDGTCVPLTGTLSPGARQRVNIGALGLIGTAGELAIVDLNDVVHSFIAWGADPTTLDLSLVAAAVTSGATKAGAFIPVPFPMPTSLAVARTDLVEGCVTAELPSPAAPEPCPTVAPALFVTEICPSPCSYVAVAPFSSCTGPEGCDAGQTCTSNNECAAIPVPSSAVEIWNPGADAVPLYGARLCRRPDCVVFERTLVIGAQDRIAIFFGTPRPVSPLSARAGELFYPELSVLGRKGELALFAPGRADVSSGAGMQSFVRFGSAPSELAQIAALMSLWPDPLATAHTVRIDGESLSHDLTTASSDTAWNPATPTLLAANLDIRSDTDLWDSCSFPRPWREAWPSSLVVYRVLRTTPPAIELLNRSTDGSAVSLVNYSLVLDGVSYALASGPDIASGGSLTLRLMDTGCNETELCVGAREIGLSGEIALVDASGTPVVRHYLRWTDNAAAPPPAGAASAVQDGVWPLERCTLGGLEPDHSIELSIGVSGHSPADYR